MALLTLVSNPAGLALSFAPAEQAPLDAGKPKATDLEAKDAPNPPPYWITNQKAKKVEPPPKETPVPYWSANSGPASPLETLGDPTAVDPPKTTETAALFAPPPTPVKPKATPAKVATKGKGKGEPEAQRAVLTKEFSFYKFTDESGVTYLTDAPVDPRYRLFTVQIVISRGSAPYRRLNLDNLKPLILKAAAKHRVNPVLITAIIKAESAFDPKAVSWAGARGLMQLMPKTAKLVGCADSFDPEQNIMGGTRYIRLMLDRFNNNISLAVAAYNSGPERVAKNMAIPDISETRNYVRVVLKNLELFEELFEPEEILLAQPVAPKAAPAPAKSLEPRK
ncbi:MAG: transglycosylase SLT domain-containing protein [Deltaproteobacteria bacterium]|nr:transglycosylase SLT domain-containing protein [Deltaproteobacteria bacterium]